jgi:PAP2 superfamily C-terminal
MTISLSGHTAIAVLGVTEIARVGRRWLTALAMVIALFEIAAVLILRAHYTMDVFTGIVTGLYAAHLAGLISTTLRGYKIPGEVKSTDGLGWITETVIEQRCNTYRTEPDTDRDHTNALRPAQTIRLGPKPKA